MSKSVSSDQKNIKTKLSLLPEKPGCYLMKDSNGTVIYVGKAKVLRNRVRSYFSGTHDMKTQRLVSEISDFEYIVTASNTEALILECNLIKKYFPKYNILLKDDKSYPYIKITYETHPRLIVTRSLKKDKGKYFGPYPNASAAQETKKLLDRIYPLRKCGKMPDRVCLYYHMGQCLAPCEYNVEPQQYEQMIKEITKFLNGGHKEIKQELQRKMETAASEWKFERAAELRDLIHHIDTLMNKQTITLNDAMDRDVIGYATDKGWMCIQILYMRGGKMIERKASMFPYYGEEIEDFTSFVTQYYDGNPALPREILLPESLDDIHEELSSWLKTKVIVPKRGSKKQAVRMAEENAKTALEEKFMLLARDEERTVKAAEQLGQWLNIGPLHRIEAFDNSHIQGSSSVSAMVVFTDGKPDKKEYRKYKMKEVQGSDDYATMREVIRRRYERVLKENLPLPDLILVDGGKGQLKAALEVIEDELGLDIPVCGLAKDEKHKTAQLLYGSPVEPVPLPRDSQEFYLLQRIQEEVHRFAVSFHRATRGRSMVQSKLDAIPGIGPKRRNKLLKHFGSLRKMREASIEDFKPLGISNKLAALILATLNEEGNGGGSGEADAK